MSLKGQHRQVSLSVLLERESANVMIEKPEIVHGLANENKKGEDFTLFKTECQRTMRDGVTTFKVFGIGPLRCWPGGLCLSRSIGDKDVGEFIVPVPYVKQIKISTAGGRMIISSDGVWDSLSAEAALDCCRGMPPDAQIVKEALRADGLRDDTTCIVIDILPQEKPAVPLTPKKRIKRMFMSLFRIFSF